MTKKPLSNYQKNVVSNYYSNLDTIMLTKISDIVTDLYLAETEKKKLQLWQRAEKAMKNLKIPNAIIEHIMNERNVEILAKNLQDWEKQK